MAKRAALASVSNDPLAVAQSRLSEAYSNGSGSGRLEAVDPALAQLLLELGLKVLGRCLSRQNFTGEAIRSQAASPTILTRLAVRRQVAAGLRNRHDFRPLGRRWDAQRMVDAILSATASASAQEIEAVYPAAVEAAEDES